MLDPNFSILLPMFAAIDTSVTWLMVKSYDDPSRELNPIARFLWGKLGYDAGSLILFLMSFSLTLIASFVFDIRILYLFAGAYSIVMIVHWHNIIHLLETRKNKSEVKIINLPEEASYEQIQYEAN